MRSAKILTDRQTDRQNNFDLLRILSTFAVILIHANATIANENNISLVGYNFQNFINVVTRFSVPCFVMMSGAFLLNNKNNAEYKKFYKKSFYKIGIPLIIFTILEFIISIIRVFINNGKFTAPVYKLITGNISNYWFMFMLIGLYFLVPIIIRVKDTVSKKSYCIGSFVWLFVACISQFTSTYKVSYSFGVIFAFVGYFLIGNVIYENCKNIKPLLVIFCLIISLLLFIFTFFFRIYTGFSLYTIDAYVNWFSPTIVIASLLLFISFANIKIKYNLSKVSSLTFIIYLFHTEVYLSIIAVINKIIPVFSEYIIIYTFLVTIIAFFISSILSVIYLKIWNYFEHKFNLKVRFLG